MHQPHAWDHTGRQVDGCKTAGHNLRDDIIDVFVHLPQTDALNWLRRGTAHRAILARHIANLPDAKDLQKVRIAPACLLIVNSLGPLFALVTAGRLGRARTMKEKSKAMCSRTLVLNLDASEEGDTRGGFFTPNRFAPVGVDFAPLPSLPSNLSPEWRCQILGTLFLLALLPCECETDRHL